MTPPPVYRLSIWTRRFTSRDGGMGTWIEQMAQMACHLEIATEVCYFTSDPPDWASRSRLPYRCHFIQLPRSTEKSFSWKAFLAMARSVWHLRQGLKECDALIEIFGEPSDLKFWTWALARRQLKSYGLVIGCRTFDDHMPSGWKKKIRNRFFLSWMKGARSILVDGEDIRSELVRHGVDADRIQVMYAAVDTRRYHPEVAPRLFFDLLAERGIQKPEGPLLLYCGRLLFMNRPQDFLEILKAIPEAWGVIIGDGEDRAELERLALPLKERLVFLGYQSEELLASAFRSADVCLFPLSSMIAGISLVVPKAMACGAAVVTNDVADMGSLVRSEENGILCQEGNLEQWIEATRRLLNDSDLRTRLGRQALETIRKGWTEEVREKRYYAWYSRLMTGETAPEASSPLASEEPDLSRKPRSDE